MPEYQHTCQCSCGQTQFTVQGMPLLRAYCHCTICQEFNQAPFADICLYKAKDVILPDPQIIEYKAYRPPPAVQRGKCKACQKPAIEYMQIFPLPKLIIIPSVNLPADCLIEPSLHVFYHSRVSDIDDDLPKVNDYLKSQIAFGRALFIPLLRGSASVKK